MTDAHLMDAGCIHGILWHQCDLCRQPTIDECVASLIRSAKTVSLVRGVPAHNIDDTINLTLRVGPSDADFLLRFIGGATA